MAIHFFQNDVLKVSVHSVVRRLVQTCKRCHPDRFSKGDAPRVGQIRMPPAESHAKIADRHPSRNIGYVYQKAADVSNGVSSGEFDEDVLLVNQQRLSKRHVDCPHLIVGLSLLWTETVSGQGNELDAVPQ